MRATGRLPSPFGSARFVDPGNRYLARFATPWRRFGAAIVDWGLCYALYLFASIPLGMLQNLGQVSWEARDFGGRPGQVLFVVAGALTVTPVLAYWLLLLPTSQTYGMRLTGLRRVSTSTGRGISYLRAGIHTVVTSAFGIAVYAVLMDLIAWDERERLDELSTQLLDASYALAVVGCVSAFVMVVSPTRRSLHERVFGTATLDELEAVAPTMGPWGPLDAFDTRLARPEARG